MSGSENTDGVSACARFISGERFSAMNSRTSFSKPRSSALKVRSIWCSCSGWRRSPAKRGVTAIVVSAAPEKGIEREQALEVGADFQLFSDPHRAVKLHRLFGHEAGAFADLGLGGGGGAAARDRLGVRHQRGA